MKYIIHQAGNRAEVIENCAEAVRQTPTDRAYIWERTEYRKARTNPQNALLFGHVYPPLMEHCGLRGERDREELHEYWCGEFFGWVEYDLLGKRKQRPARSTTKDESGKRAVMSTREFSDFVEFVIQRAAEIGVLIPDPLPGYLREMGND